MRRTCKLVNIAGCASSLDHSLFASLESSVLQLVTNEERQKSEDQLEFLMWIEESDCPSVLKDGVNSLPKEGHKKRKWTDLTPKDLDLPLIIHIRPLPVDVIINVLSRIKGRALLKILLACKDWWSLTKNAFFIDLHLSRAVRCCPPDTIMLWHTEHNNQVRYTFKVLNHLWQSQFYLQKEYSDPILVTPPCNGLLCIYNFKRSITVCNLTTQKFMDLPRATPNRVMVNVYPKCSFGFDPVRSQYKVVRFFYLKVDHLNQSYNLGCEVITPGDTLWKSIAFISCYPIGPGVHAKGSIYWMIGSGAQNILTDKIIALNLANEKFRDISTLATRSQFSNDDEESISLAQLEGNLCVIYVRFLGYSTMDIWMLKDYVGNMWMHVCHIMFSEHWNDLRDKIEPISMYDGKVILRWGRDLYEYNLQDGKTRNVFHAPYVRPHIAFSFVQSLVSLGDST